MRLTHFYTALLFATLLAGIAGCGPDDARGGAGKGAADAKKKLTRDEFRALVEGKNRKEVLEKVGKPSSTKIIVSGDEKWHFDQFVTDPITGKTQDAEIWFDKGEDTAKNLTFP